MFGNLLHALVNTIKYTFEGNVIADLLANKEVRDKLIGAEPKCYLSQQIAKGEIVDQLRKQHDLHWSGLPGMGQTQMFMGGRTRERATNTWVGNN